MDSSVDRSDAKCVLSRLRKVANCFQKYRKQRVSQSVNLTIILVQNFPKSVQRQSQISTASTI